GLAPGRQALGDPATGVPRDGGGRGLDLFARPAEGLRDAVRVVLDRVLVVLLVLGATEDGRLDAGVPEGTQEHGAALLGGPLPRVHRVVAVPPEKLDQDRGAGDEPVLEPRQRPILSVPLLVLVEKGDDAAVQLPEVEGVV